MPTDISTDKLTEEEGKRLQSLLHHIRHVEKHTYKEIARSINVPVETLWNVSSGRSMGTEALRKSIEKYANDMRIQFNSYKLRVDIKISEEQVKSDSLRLAGRYLCFTVLPQEAEKMIGVTLVTLLAKKDHEYLPEFGVWRPGIGKPETAISQRGYYYTNHDSLYLIGITSQTNYLRLLSLEKVASETQNLFFGTLSTSSRDDLSFQSWCYFIPSPSMLTLRRNNWKELGIFGASQISDSYPTIARALQDKTALRVPRSGNSFQG